MTIWSLNRREWTSNSTCPEYDKLQWVAEELLTSLAGATSPEQFAQAQQSLLFLFQELEQRTDPLHPRFPGGHRCLEHCYLEYATRIRTKALLLKPATPQPPEAPPAPYATPEQVVADLGELIQHRPDETVLGEDVEPTP